MRSCREGDTGRGSYLHKPGLEVCVYEHIISVALEAVLVVHYHILHSLVQGTGDGRKRRKVEK